MPVALYEKKPVTIAAVQFDGTNAAEIKEFCKGFSSKSQDNEIIILTLEGEMRVAETAYVVRGVKGEFYPVHEETFNDNYEVLGGGFFKKKPVQLKAIQFDGSNFGDMADFVGLSSFSVKDGCLSLPREDGVLVASPNDFILQGLKGEFYPCKPDIFVDTYTQIS